MQPITLTDQMIQIDAGLVARGLNMDQATLRQAMQDGEVTRVFERGEGEDAGRFRVTFYSQNRRLRLLFNAEGTILQSSSSDYIRKARGPGAPLTPFRPWGSSRTRQ